MRWLLKLKEWLWGQEVPTSESHDDPFDEWVLNSERPYLIEENDE